MRAIDRTGAAAIAFVSLMFSACERRSAGEPWVIPGPTVPSVVLQEPFVWDTRDELKAWTDNTVSRGPFRLDAGDTNGAINIDFVADGPYLLLRGPNLDPPLTRVRAVRIRYVWLPSDGRSTGTLAVRFDAVNSPRVDLQFTGLPICGRPRPGSTPNCACPPTPSRTRRST
jgi:hypothetical protein